MTNQINRSDVMKKLVTPMVIASMLITASPAFAYTVKPGDSLSQIAVNEHITLIDLIKTNPQIKNPNLIFPGDVIETKQTPDVASPPTVVNTTYSAYDLDVLSRIVEAEAGGEPYEGKIAVAEVIMNRVASPEYPSSIEAVVYQPRQFSPVSNGMINKPASDDSIRAATEVLSTYKGNPNGALYFYNPSKTSDKWVRSRAVVEVIGNHIFSK
jgi:N-acetylmuramoyl-L-alanine amidase